MEPSVEGWAIVLAGAWNPAIFTPAWIIGRLTENEEIGIAFPVDEPNKPPRFNFDEIFLRIEGGRLVLTPSSAEDEPLVKMQSVADKILEQLPHTPINGVGVNFQFLESDPGGELAHLFTLNDAGILSDADYEVKNTSVKRTLKKNDHLLNLTLTLRENASVLLTFNFHRDVANSTAARETLEAGVLSFKELAYELLDGIYKTPVS